MAHTRNTLPELRQDFRRSQRILPARFVPPQPAPIFGRHDHRHHDLSLTTKKSRRPVRSGGGSGGRGWDDPPVLEQAGDASLAQRAAGGAHIPANDDRKSATVTATDRKQANQLDRGG